jgi:hypothetical protein
MHARTLWQCGECPRACRGACFWCVTRRPPEVLVGGSLIVIALNLPRKVCLPEPLPSNPSMLSAPPVLHLCYSRYTSALATCVNRQGMLRHGLPAVSSVFLVRLTIHSALAAMPRVMRPPPRPPSFLMHSALMEAAAGGPCSRGVQVRIWWWCRQELQALLCRRCGCAPQWCHLKSLGPLMDSPSAVLRLLGHPSGLVALTTRRCRSGP